MLRTRARKRSPPNGTHELASRYFPSSALREERGVSVLEGEVLAGHAFRPLPGNDD